jgi:branched-chain amino acid transport system substrate-binding protein
LIVPVAFTRDLTAPAMANPWILRTIETTDQSNFTLGTWIFKNTPHRKLLVMASDYAAGRHAAGAIMAAFKVAGKEIVKDIYPPLSTPDFAPYRAQVGWLKADALYAFFVGADAIRFVKTYQDYGLTGKLPIFIHLAMVDDDTLAAMGDSALGIIAVANCTATLDTPENQPFVKEYASKYNSWPHFVAEGGYLAGQLIASAIEALKRGNQ